MHEAQVNVICPDCASPAKVPVDEAKSVCPYCGCRLTLPAGVCAHHMGEDDLEKAPLLAESDVEDESLIAHLRRAFEYHVDTLASADSCWLGANGGSSAAFGGAYGAVALPVGTRLGDFQILGELGRGGMGIVYRARQVSLGREVALKVLPGYARHGQSAVKRFKAEAQAAARLHHTNVVSIYSQGEHRGQYYHAMELIEGVSLDAVIRSRPDLLSSNGSRGGSSAGWSIGEQGKPVSVTAAAQPADGGDDANGVPEANWTPVDYRHLAALLADVADALHCAHEHGVIHRDVKPHNLLLGTDNRLHLTDFGLARLTEEPHLTVDGEVMGTPAYLSPEQVRGDRGEIDHRTDIYSLGVTLYELITRRKPFQGETREQIIAGICMNEPVAPRRVVPKIPQDLETICLRAMRKDSARRHQSADLLADDLRRFAQGRTILSRRPTRLQKAVKWVRRHKVSTTVVAATVAVMAIAVVAGWNTRVAHRREAQRLLHNAYEQLAFFDYHRPQRVESDIGRAEALGADPGELDLVRGLIGLGSGDQQSAIHHLEAVLEQAPSDLRALYMLAWSQWKNRDRAASRATFEQAESVRASGAGMTADAWLFRGLAVHFDDPSVAMESYRRANALRARDQGFYPLAVLHLARARNQKLYATRSLEGFSEAQSSLRQLIENEYYGAYPHYLLSITHRLAAEIYQGSQGTRDGSLVADHYADSLKWARLGQEVEPDSDRPITAEAECLESMGLYAEAIEIRNRAIKVATRDIARCESHHYRWRLHYWMGELDAALADVAVHAECDPQSRFYAHVYPALLLAELGDVDAALSHARALAADAPESALAVVWSATCLRLLGQAEEAAELLGERADEVDFGTELAPPQSQEWVEWLYAYCRDGGPSAELEELAEQADAPWRLWGELHFHAAAMNLADGDREGALAEFRRAYRSFDGEQRYTYHAKLIWIRMRNDPAWPAWIAVSSREAPGINPREERDQ
ncbi:MAG: protein kinase [Phycisphaerae bacterium]|nr:protein kinase [Phycisphaerae bacterium]